jgi:SAM-dependent methyltransferase
MKSSAPTLLPSFLEVYPFQPATALWRAVEIAVLAEAGLPPGLGLDLGCGDGLLTSLVLEACGKRELIGIDPDPDEVALATATGIYRDLHIAGGDAIPLPNDTVDWVLSNSVLEHIPDVGPVLAEAARVLKPGGRCVFTVPSPEFHALLRGPLWRSSDKARAQYLRDMDRRVAHYYYWSEGRWRQELERVGLHLDDARPYLDWSQTRRWETISRLTAGLLVLAFGNRKRPIEIQRTLGMRSAGRGMPESLARPLARALRFGIRLDATESVGGSCLLLRATKLRGRSAA